MRVIQSRLAARVFYIFFNEKKKKKKKDRVFLEKMFWQVRYRYDNRNQKVQMIARSYAKRRQWKGLRKMPNGSFTSTKIETRLPIVSERSEGSWRRKMDYLQNLHCFYVNRLYHCAGSIGRPPFCKPSRRNPCDCSPAHAVFCYSKHSVLNLRMLVVANT